jgi:hypothetical protein
MRYISPRSIFIFFLAACSLSVSAQNVITKIDKLLNIWIYTEEQTEQKGVLIGASDSALFIYSGSITAYGKEASPPLINMRYDDIRTIKIKKRGAFLKGLLIGGGIGLSPAFFGQGGAYAAVVTFPLGIIVGSIIGATSKKKYEINDNLETFAKFTRKYIK